MSTNVKAAIVAAGLFIVVILVVLVPGRKHQVVVPEGLRPGESLLADCHWGTRIVQTPSGRVSEDVAIDGHVQTRIPISPAASLKDVCG